MFFGSLIVLASVGLAAALMLTIASKFFYVQEDPKIAAVSEVLPGANCGGCGYAGCDGYAEAVVNNPAVPTNLCCVGGADVTAKVGTLTGKGGASSEPTHAFRRCIKNEGNVKSRYFYDGMDTCAAAARLNNGTEACPHACLGFGDCVRVCQFNALILQEGLPLVLTLNCTSCGKCVKACPRSIISIIPQRSRVMVYCSTQDKLKAVSEVCDAGCIKCMKCVKLCPAGAIKLTDNRIEIDHAKCLEHGPECNEACVTGCPRKVLRMRCTPERLLNPENSVELAKDETAGSAPAQAAQEQPEQSKAEQPAKAEA